MDEFQEIHLERVIKGSPLGDSSHGHGLKHWESVLKNAILLAEELDIGPRGVESLYWASLYHDSQRISEFSDPGHGGRGAMALWKDTRFELDLTVLEIAMMCCAVHTDAKPKNGRQILRGLDDFSKSIIECFCDADRLDLVRFGYEINPEYLFTEQAIYIAEERLCLLSR